MKNQPDALDFQRRLAVFAIQPGDLRMAALATSLSAGVSYPTQSTCSTLGMAAGIGEFLDRSPATAEQWAPDVIGMDAQFSAPRSAS